MERRRRKKEMKKRRNVRNGGVKGREGETENRLRYVWFRKGRKGEEM